jgi:hypothetical protein
VTLAMHLVGPVPPSSCVFRLLSYARCVKGPIKA